MKRIAIQYSGEIRELLSCWNNQYEHLILPNKDYQVDIFGHFWLYPHEKEKRLRLVKQIPFTRVLFEEPVVFDNSIHKEADQWWFFNMRSMFYGIEKVNDIRKSYEIENNITYDYVIRIRPDMIFIQNSMNPIEYYEKDFIHVENSTLFEDYGINDYFAIGGSELMDKYCKVYSNLENMINEGAAVIPECLIGYNIKDLPIKKQNFRIWAWKYVYIILSDILDAKFGKLENL